MRWNFHMEPFAKDGESTGFGRFVGLVDGLAVAQMWFVPGGVKIEHAQGYAVQLDIERKEITILQKM
ncbi:MAG: hypothetical protein BAA01_09415 [Bacillus thermozeamaize]|uniref:Uncharacterized protein n=1 Tax=Bacillus thermozeamaize TaxID=230954 RepID=A0A1Y3PHP6_9BACI|nr:MAG: hypothetical protein BAA01_09415 [Bacillus thermozeamaize]